MPGSEIKRDGMRKQKIKFQEIKKGNIRRNERKKKRKGRRNARRNDRNETRN